MKRVFSVFLTSAVVVCFFAVAALAAAKAPADGLKMAKTQKSVVFNHSTHKKVDCKDCHHEWDGAGAVKKCSDAGCHDVMDKADKSVKSYYQAMHNKKAKVSTCVSCHDAEAAKLDKEAGKKLKSCAKSVCHP
ncbi:MAG: cytochrome c3 family protein [Thermodesulfobacteriota bacterium]